MLVQFVVKILAIFLFLVAALIATTFGQKLDGALKDPAGPVSKTAKNLFGFWAVFTVAGAIAVMVS